MDVETCTRTPDGWRNADQEMIRTLPMEGGGVRLTVFQTDAVRYWDCPDGHGYHMLLPIAHPRLVDFTRWDA